MLTSFDCAWLCMTLYDFVWLCLAMYDLRNKKFDFQIAPYFSHSPDPPESKNIRMSSEDQWEVPPLELSSFIRRRQREIPAKSESCRNSVHDQKFKKTKGTLFPQTLKVEKNKVPLDIAIFFTFRRPLVDMVDKKWENGYISAPKPKLKILRALYFL